MKVTGLEKAKSTIKRTLKSGMRRRTGLKMPKLKRTGLAPKVQTKRKMKRKKDLTERARKKSKSS